ncbi:hypothetical protein J2W49_004318 [Hydrogenophaga palleronii]|uniref:Uncharacterized protein n=1 Tax=Hydrogenophaga palleronii TaxID=65655 RepID=A0ABU1WTY0_9BURK|nr:hypothetical protein [Hydrogenophaga palleronii]MDR7152342.1 hypothetical protein [Hydrogenophaga palleronii]
MSLTTYLHPRRTQFDAFCNYPQRKTRRMAMDRQHKQFLTGLAPAQPDWTLLQCPHASELPALRWKLGNLQTFSQRRPADFEKQAAKL